MDGGVAGLKSGCLDDGKLVPKLKLILWFRDLKAEKADR